MPSAEETDNEIRRLLVERGLGVPEVSERVGMPDVVIESWIEQQGDVATPEDEASDSETEEKAPKGVYRCSECKDIVATAEMTEHEEDCLRGADWSSRHAPRT